MVLWVCPFLWLAKYIKPHRIVNILPLRQSISWILIVHHLSSKILNPKEPSSPCIGCESFDTLLVEPAIRLIKWNTCTAASLSAVQQITFRHCLSSSSCTRESNFYYETQIASEIITIAPFWKLQWADQSLLRFAVWRLQFQSLTWNFLSIRNARVYNSLLSK